MPKRARNYAAEYARRIAKAEALGLSRSQARGHARAIEPKVSELRRQAKATGRDLADVIRERQPAATRRPTKRQIIDTDAGRVVDTKRADVIRSQLRGVDPSTPVSMTVSFGYVKKYGRGFGEVDPGSQAGRLGLGRGEVTIAGHPTEPTLTAGHLLDLIEREGGDVFAGIEAAARESKGVESAYDVESVHMFFER